MFVNVIIGLVAMFLCLFIQALLVGIAIEFYARHQTREVLASFMATVTLIGCVMLVLVLGNFLQIMLWGTLFVYLGEFENFRTAVYHSAVNFSTLGYGDIVMSEERRVLGPIQALNGVLMVGVSTAVMMFTLQDSLKRTIAGLEKSEG